LIFLKHSLRCALFLLILTGSLSPCLAQTNKSAGEQPPGPDGEFNPASWKEYFSAEGRFSILFPGTPQEGVHSVDVQGGQLKIHVHNLKAYAEYGVIYADYPIPVGDPRVAKQVLDNGAKGGAAEVNAELLSMTEISIDGHPGRLLRERLPSGSILKAKMYLVGQRLYQIAVTMPKAETDADSGNAHEKLADKFLDSFKIVAEQATGGVDRFLAQEKVFGKATGNYKGIIVEGGILEGKAISFPQPVYPPIARAARASGKVTVKVIVDEEGKVVAAQAESGHPLLQQAAVKAAREARFSPPMLEGKPVKIVGVINYNFEDKK
jgi:TonB family protein